MAVISAIGDGLWNAFQMAWEVGWALVLGFALSGVVQAWIPRSRMEQALGGRDLRTAALSTGLGAASSSCSYAAVAIAKSMFQKGASLASAMVFQFASTNLVFEIGIVMWIFLGWEFTLAEFVGGLLLIVFMWAGIRYVVTRRLEEQAREHALEAQTGHEHHMAGSKGLTWRERLTSLKAWSDVAHNFRGDVEMLWKEIAAGFLIAGFVALLPMDFFNALFLTDAPAWIRIPENVVVGPLVAILSFVCSVGNVPLAAVLWNGGISFGGVIAFIFGDLIIAPILNIYRKYYGLRMAAVLAAVLYVTMVAAGFAVELLFQAAGIVPTERNAKVEMATVSWNYTTYLNVLFLSLAAVLVWRYFRRGGGIPMLRMMNAPAGEGHGHHHAG
jgi:uncharacterized membrane protein YraQ (UPF0718 family)